MLFCTAVAALLLVSKPAAAIKRPNIVLVLTDDQDVHMNSIEHMPLVQKYLQYEGTTYDRHYCTITLCCPARVSLLTGKAAHNTNVTDIFPPFGGYPKFISEGHNENYLPVWLQAAGYSTYYVGKLLNHHSTENYDNPPVKGWTGSDFLLDPYTYEYMNAHFSRNGGKPVSYAGHYSPDVTAQKAYGFLDVALANSKQPFFLAVAPIASHGDIVQVPLTIGKPKYAKRHAHLFKDYKIPRTENFNPKEASGVSWIAELPPLNDTVIAYNDEYQRARLRSLQSVDEMVENLIKQLSEAGELENTYFFYTTDNGYHISQHRMHPGKSCGYETDINVPMIVRGPGVERGVVSHAVTAHTDITPTIMSIAGAMRDEFDGSPMPLKSAEREASRTELVAVEYWGYAGPEGKFGFKGDWGGGDKMNGSVGAYSNNTYKGIRIIGEQYNLYYSTWCTGEHELYDVGSDPSQVRNLLDKRYAMAASQFSVAGRPLAAVLDRLEAMIVVLMHCKQYTCRDPWRVLHSKHDTVHSLAHALDKKHDDMYREYPRLQFERCEMGFIKESEKIVSRYTDVPYGRAGVHYEQKPLDEAPHWSEFV